MPKQKQENQMKVKETYRMLPLVNHNVKCMSFGFLSKERESVAWRGPMASSALDRMARDTDWGELDVLIVDMPPGTGDIQITYVDSII